VPQRRRDQVSMNSDHTHFIIVREQPMGSSSMNSPSKKSPANESGEKQLEKLADSAESATNKFRDRFEEFIHQETLQTPANTGTTDNVAISMLIPSCDRSKSSSREESESVE
jgi:hypothetical protein